MQYLNNENRLNSSPQDTKLSKNSANGTKQEIGNMKASSMPIITENNDSLLTNFSNVVNQIFDHEKGVEDIINEGVFVSESPNKHPSSIHYSEDLVKDTENNQSDATIQHPGPSNFNYLKNDNKSLLNSSEDVLQNLDDLNTVSDPGLSKDEIEKSNGEKNLSEECLKEDSDCSDTDLSESEANDSEYSLNEEEKNALKNRVGRPKIGLYEKYYSSPMIGRLQSDIVDFYKDPPPGIFIAPDEEDITNIFALIIGPEGTPYEGGFFNFQLNFPKTYPIEPPKAKLLTTGEGQIRFNPNLYKTGRVCLSILGTWSGPSWSSVLSLSSVLISIQSLMNEKPYHNEPGYEKEVEEGVDQKYNDCITHETIRVAVCDMLEGTTADIFNMPENLKLEMRKAFPKYIDYYMNTVYKNMNLTKQSMQDPHKNNDGVFRYDSLKTRLEALILKYPKENIEEQLDI